MCCANNNKQVLLLVLDPESIQRSLNFLQTCSDIVSLTKVFSEDGNFESHSSRKEKNTCNVSKK